MMKFKSRFTFFTLIAFVFIIFAGIFYSKLGIRNIQGEVERNAQTKVSIDTLLAYSTEVHRIWWEGEESKEWIKVKDQCLKKFNLTKNFDETLLRCNPMLIECVDEFDKNKKFNLAEIGKNKGKYIYVTKANSGRLQLNSSSFGFRLIEPNQGEKLDILLEDNCREIYLDQRIYAYGEMPKTNEGDDFRFDNMGLNIYLDKYLVTNFEINQWIKFGQPEDTKNLKIKLGDELFRPATKLFYEQMEKYCAFRGKQIMQAHYFDAATFYPFELENKTPNKIERTPYYWSKRKIEKSFECNLIFGKDCSNNFEYSVGSIQPTWGGLQDSMGGVFEAMKNPIEPELNLKISSFYLSLNSSEHRLGNRAYWDGQGFSIGHFNFDNIDIDKTVSEYQVGFRCMREAL